MFDRYNTLQHVLLSIFEGVVMSIKNYNIMSGYSEYDTQKSKVRFFCDLERKLQDSELADFEKRINSGYIPLENDPQRKSIVASINYISDSQIAEEVIREQIALAREASLAYRSVSMETRVKVVKAIKKMIIEKVDLWNSLTTQEGYSEPARASSLDSVLQYASDHNIERIVKQLRPYRIENDVMESKPYGVIGFEAPANASFPMQSQFIIGAVILAGNAAIIKPPFLTPLVGTALVCEINEIMKSFHLPDGLLSSIIFPSSKFIVNRWLGLDNSMNRVITKSSQRIDNLVFIGGSGSRDKILALCEKGGIYNPILELEGSDIAYIDNSFGKEELEDIARTITYGKLTAGGQYCLSLEHVIIDKNMDSSLKSYFIECLKKEFGRYRVEKLSSDFKYNISPSGKPRAIKDLLEELKSIGTVICGGNLLNSKNKQDDKGLFVQPTIVEIERKSVPDKELFSNVLILTESDGTVESVVDYINDKSFGLRSSIHSKNQDTIDFLTERIKSGTIIVNGNHLNFRFGIAGGTGLTSNDSQARDWALDTVRRRFIVQGGTVQMCTEDVLIPS